MTRKAKALWTRWDAIPDEMVAVARRRTEFLLDGPVKMVPLPVLIANAYLLGVSDAAEIVLRSEQNENAT